MSNCNYLKKSGNPDNPEFCINIVIILSKTRHFLAVILAAILSFGIVQESLAACGSPPDPWGNASGYRAWCSCMGGTYYSDTTACKGATGPQKSPTTPRSPAYTPPAIDYDAIRRQQELKRHQRQKAEEKARKREQARRKQFKENKKNALKLLKSGAGELGLKSASGGGIKLKGTRQTTLKLKEPLFSKGHKGSAPPDLRGLDQKWPIVVDLKKVQGKTPQALKQANLRTHALLDALEAGKGDWRASIRYLQNKLKANPRDIHVRDALNLLRGYHNGYLGAKAIADNYYKYGVRKWLAGDFDHAARSFARAYRENPGDKQLLHSFAHTLGLRDGSGKCKKFGKCSRIDIPKSQLALELGITKEMKKNLETAKAAIKANPGNIKLRAGLNYLEGLEGYNDYLNIALEEKQKPFDKKTVQMTNQGLKKLGLGDYAGAFKIFAKAYKSNVGDDGIAFAMNYARGLSAVQGADAEQVPDALWDKRTRKVYEEMASEIDGKLLSNYFFPRKTSTSALTRQLKNTAANNPFFGILSDTEVEQLLHSNGNFFK